MEVIHDFDVDVLGCPNKVVYFGKVSVNVTMYDSKTCQIIGKTFTTTNFRCFDYMKNLIRDIVDGPYLDELLAEFYTVVPQPQSRPYIKYNRRYNQQGLELFLKSVLPGRGVLPGRDDVLPSSDYNVCLHWSYDFKPMMILVSHENDIGHRCPQDRRKVHVRDMQPINPFH